MTSRRSIFRPYDPDRRYPVKQSYWLRTEHGRILQCYVTIHNRLSDIEPCLRPSGPPART